MAEYQKNHEKQEAYAQQKTKLKRALASKFFYEAIFVEYAIIEDRANSVLLCAGVKTVTKDGESIGLKKKLDRIKDNQVFHDPFIRKRLTNDLIVQIQDWRVKRNDLIHDLMNMSVEEEELQELVEQGKKLMDIFDNRIKSVTNYLLKKGSEKGETRQ